MAYRFSQDKTIEHNLRSIAGQQIDRAIDEVEDATLDRDEAIHQVRKRCKKVRGLIRLVRPAFDDYALANEQLRNAARPLSQARDAGAMVECFDELMSHYGDEVDGERLAPIRAQLEQRRQEALRNQVVLEDRLGTFVQRMREVRPLVDQWQIDADGFEAIAPGLGKTYKRARKGLKRAYRKRDADNFHEWRKRVKYHWCHNRLLRDIWPGVMKARVKETHRLSGLLGDEHDLAVLRQVVSDQQNSVGDTGDLQLLLGLIDRRRAELQAAARPLGERLFGEKPKRLTARYADYWRVASGG